MPDQREIALNHLKLYGPSLPVQVAKALNTNILFASAVLSELTSRKQVLFTHASIGGSKIYYLKGQEAQKEEKISPSLKGREKQAYELLKEKKVLRDIELEPWQRVALRDLKDFAIPLTVSLAAEAELFWKIHLLTDEEAKPLIEAYIETPEPTTVQKTETLKETKQEFKQEEMKAQQLQREQASLQQELLNQKLQQEKAELEQTLKNLKEELLKNPKQATLQELKKQEHEEPIQEIKLENKEITLEIKAKKPEGKFYSTISNYLENNKIEILKEEMIKKTKNLIFLFVSPQHSDN